MIVDSNQSPEELMILFNARRANWVTRDYMRCYCTRGLVSYLRVQKLIELFPSMDIKAAVQIIKGGHSTITFNNGALEISKAEYAAALSRCRALQALSQIIGNIVFRRDIILAFYKVVSEIKDFQDFLERSRNFSRPSTEKCSD